MRAPKSAMAARSGNSTIILPIPLALSLSKGPCVLRQAQHERMWFRKSRQVDRGRRAHTLFARQLEPPAVRFDQLPRERQAEAAPRFGPAVGTGPVAVQRTR